MNISNKSPHLEGYLKRLIKSGKINSYADLDEAFTWCMQNGGIDEHDFIREAGVSFNPRPARVAIILMKEEGVQDLDILTAAVLSSCADKIHNYDNASDEIKSLVSKSMQPASIILEYKPAVIALANRLDRARQLHRCNLKDASIHWPKFLEENSDYLTLAEKHSKSLSILLSSWEKRFRTQFYNG